MIDAVRIRRPAVTAALGAMTAGILCLTIFMTAPAEAMLATLLAVVLVTPFLASWAADRLDLGEIVHPIMASYLAYFVFRTFYLLPAGFTADDRPDFAQSVTPALLLALLGILAFLTGYYAPLGRGLARRIGERLRAPDPARAQIAVYLFFLVGIVCRAYIYSRGSYAGFLAAQREPVGPVELTIDYFGVFSYYAFLLGVGIAYSRRCTSQFRTFVWTILIPLTVVMALLHGSKLHIIWLLIGWALARHYFHRRLTASWLIALIAISLFVVFPLVGAYRTAVSSNLDRNLHQAGRPTYEALRDLWSAGFVSQVIDMVSGRVSGVDTLALVVQNTPDAMPYQHGRTMILAPIIAFVPTLFWPGKSDFVHSIASGEDFGRLYFGRVDDGTSIAITQLGEFYLNFGWVGIPIGMFCFGLVCKAAYGAFTATEPQPTSLLVYLYLYFHLTFIEGWFGTTYSNLFKTLVTTAAIAGALQDRRRAPTR